jgi:hypothetical protein
MSMVGRNGLGLQPVGEHLLAKISALCVFYVMFIFVVYLIISNICILMCLSTSYVFYCLSLLYYGIDLVLCMWFSCL